MPNSQSVVPGGLSCQGQVQERRNRDDSTHVGCCLDPFSLIDNPSRDYCGRLAKPDSDWLGEGKNKRRETASAITLRRGSFGGSAVECGGLASPRIARTVRRCEDFVVAMAVRP